MFIYYCLGLVTTLFSILSIYPFFQNSSIGLGVFFGILAVLFFYYFFESTDSINIKERFILSAVRVGHLFILTIVLELLGLWVYVQFFSNWRELTFLTPIYEFIFRLFGVPVGRMNGELFLYGALEYSHTFLPNSGNFGLIYPIMIFFGLLSLPIISKDRQESGRFIFITMGSLVLYLVFRSTVLISLFCTQEVNKGNVWYYLTFLWHPIYVFLSLLPWVMILYLLFLKRKVDIVGNSCIFKKKSLWNHIPTGITLGLVFFFITVLIFWIPSGKEKQGDILFEEYYSDWSKSTRPIDENWYSSASTYNYYTFRRYISSFYNVTVNEQPLELVNLSKYSVLILKMPTRPYPEKVIKQIESYVKNGGGLWVIGDHTNVFGSSSYLNPLLRVFGVRLRYDAVYNNETGKFNPIYPGTLIKHPIIQNVPVFLFATPCSLEINNPRLRIVLPGETTKAYEVNYGMHNFFPDTKSDLKGFFGVNILLAAGDFGRGRIAIFTDSTVFSNFHIYLPGKTEMALSIISWLNHKQSSLKLWVFFGVLISAAGFVIFYKRVNCEGRNPFWLSSLVLGFLFIAVPVVNYLNAVSCPFPKEIRPFVKAGFIEKYSSIYLPFAESKDDLQKNFNTFYTWGQREGICNRYYFELDKGLKESKAIFLVLPKNRFDRSDLDKLDLFLRKGGQIFLLDHGGAGSSANDFLRRYGLLLEYHRFGKGKMFTPRKADFIENNLPIGSIKGEAQTLLNWKTETEKIYPVFIKKKIGQGELYVFGGIQNFSNQEFGGEDIIPEGNKKKVNELILEIYRLIRKES